MCIVVCMAYFANRCAVFDRIILIQACKVLFPFMLLCCPGYFLHWLVEQIGFDTRLIMTPS